MTARPTQLQPSARKFSAEKIRADFPILATTAHGKPLVYLDNGATTQKPRAVIDAISRYYESENANIHRGVYDLSQRATARYEEARRKVQSFINAADEVEIIFTRGTTEAINLVANCFGRAFVGPGDEIIVSALEHHSNIVPWQMAAEISGARIRVLPMNDAGELLMDAYIKLLNPRTRLVAVNHVSNALGTINPVEEIIAAAHGFGARVLVDGAQWVAHFPTDVRALDADFYTFSGHKLFGPTGIGVLYGKRNLLQQMPPYQGGGDMIRTVTFEKTEYADLPNKFEAGTPDIAGAVGLGAAIDYVQSIGLQNVAPHEEALLHYATARLAEVPGLRLIGTARHKAGVLSFIMENPAIASIDIGTQLDLEGVAVRTGHHCCQPIMDRFGITSTTRASLAMYNTTDDIDALVDGLQKIAGKAAGNSAQMRGKPAPLVIEYPGPAAPTPQAAADEISEMFDMMGDPQARTELLMDLGKSVPHTFELLKKVSQRIPGCMSEVHIIGRQRDGRLEFLGDVGDNAATVRGLIAILQRLFSGQVPQNVLAFDINGFFNRIGLDQFVSSKRRNGLEGMVKRIHAIAASGPQSAANGPADAASAPANAAPSHVARRGQ